MNAEQEKLLFEARETWAAVEQLGQLIIEDQHQAYLINEEKGLLLNEVSKLLEKCGEYDVKRDGYLHKADARMREMRKLEKEAKKLERQAKRAGRRG